MCTLSRRLVYLVPLQFCENAHYYDIVKQMRMPTTPFAVAVFRIVAQALFENTVILVICLNALALGIQVCGVLHCAHL